MTTDNSRRCAWALAAIAVLLLPIQAAASVIAGPIENPANGHQYYLLSANSWTQSEAEAIGLGGHLATINDAAENQWVADTFYSINGGTHNLLWIGLSDAAQEGTFVWSSGQPVTYTNWLAGEPNAAFSTEDYAHITFTQQATWKDRRDVDGNVLYGVVEVEGPWYDLEGATAGVQGAPRLVMTGPLTAGSTIELNLLGANPAALAVVFITAASSPVDFIGGTLHAVPVGKIVVLTTDGSGQLNGTSGFVGAPSGSQYWFQVGVADPTVPVFGAALSNGVVGTTP